MIQANRSHVKEPSRGRKWLRLFVFFIGLYLTWVLARGILDIRQAYRRVDESRKRLAEAQAKNEELKRKMVEVQTREYVEKVARNELLMQKDGETVVVLTNDQPASVQSDGKAKEEKELPNYLKWWNLIK
ncbi:MAG: septum formation initiator family protein [Microgenomates group bacterium]